MHIMEYDDRPDAAKRLEEARLARGFKFAKDATDYFGWNYDTYAQHENGTRGIVRAAGRYATAYKVSEGWLLTGEGKGPGSAADKTVRIMGYLGAGAVVEPDYEQVPHEGFDQVEMPFALPDEMIAFRVRGDSMLPVFKDGAVIVVYKDQKKPLESFYGEEAAVKTRDGRRFIKTIMRGATGVNLFSWNAAPIEDVHLDWIGEIFAILPPSSLRKVAKQGGIQGQLKLRP